MKQRVKLSTVLHPSVRDLGVSEDKQKAMSTAQHTFLHPLASDLGVRDGERRIQIGLTGQYAVLCAVGAAKVRAVRGKLGFKSGNRLASGKFGESERVSAKTPYIFVRFTDAPGKVRREELGRFLLGVDVPVKHCNAAPLDFRIENLEVEPQREKKISEPKKPRESKALIPADGLTPAQQEEKLAEIFPYLLRKAAAILKDAHPAMKGPVITERGIGITEPRGPEVVADIMPALIKRIRAGRVSNIVGTAIAAVEVRARAELQRKQNGFGPIHSDAGMDAFMDAVRETQHHRKSFVAAYDNGEYVFLSNPSNKCESESEDDSDE